MNPKRIIYLATLINVRKGKIKHWKCTTKPVTQRYALLVRSVPGLGAAVHDKKSCHCQKE